MTWESFAITDFGRRTTLGLELIGRSVHDRRLLLGISQRQLEQLSGVDQTVISRLENGKLGALRWSRFATLVGALEGLDRTDPLPTWTKRFLPPAGVEDRA